MKNKVYRGRAYLRDIGPAKGIYEADYNIYAFAQNIRHIGANPRKHKVSSADIRPTASGTLKNGLYALEQEGRSLCTLRKTGALWEIVTDNLTEMENQNAPHQS